MTVREMLDHIREHYPAAKLETSFGRDPEDCFEVELTNGWKVSAGFGARHGGAGLGFIDILDTDRVEIAMFKPDGSWYLAEGMNDGHPGRVPLTGVLNWQNSEQLFMILDYVERMPG